MNAEKREAKRQYKALWSARNPEKVKSYKLKQKTEFPDRSKGYSALWRSRHPEKSILKRVKHRAKVKDLPFSITEKDIVIPDRCPVFKTPFKKGTPQAASLDRIVPDLGYVPGNIQVISTRANRIKNDATPDEIQAVANWLRRLLSAAL